MSDDEARRPGRKALAANGQPSTPVNVRLPPTDYDRTFTRAQRDGVSVPVVVRRALSKYLDDPDDDG
jgi:hypothetical protein